MKIDLTGYVPMSNEEIEKGIKEDCQNGILNSSAVNLEELKTWTDDEKQEHFQTIQCLFDSISCKKCGSTGKGLTIKSNDIHEVRTICFNCHGFIKHGWPFKYGDNLEVKK